jgi:hypothetical protein
MKSMTCKKKDEIDGFIWTVDHHKRTCEDEKYFVWTWLFNEPDFSTKKIVNQTMMGVKC